MSLTFSLTIICLLGKLCPRIIDLTIFWVVGVRCLATYMLFRLSASKSTGFEDIDPKSLHDSVSFVAMPMFVIASVNWKMDVLITWPLSMVGTAVFIEMAYTTNNGNMDCYLIPDAEAEGLIYGYVVQMAGMAMAGGFMRYMELQRFLDKEKTNRSQACLQNVFDKQQDGIIILSRVIAAPKAAAPTTKDATKTTIADDQTNADSEFSQING